MDMIEYGEKELDSLLRWLNLSKSQIEFIKKVFKFIKDTWLELRRLLDPASSSFDETNGDTDPTKIEDAAKNIQTIIDYFSENNGEGQTFMKIFPHWKEQREESIKELGEIADTIQQSKKICSTVQIVGGSIGVVGGACIIASFLFPPAAFVLPIWLGGAAVTALIPAALLPVAATSGLAAGAAIGGGIAAGAGAATQVVTSVTELAILQSQVEKAKEACQKDAAEFKEMMAWFKRTKELKDALQKLLGENVVMDALFGGLARFCRLQEDPDAQLNKSLKHEIWYFVKKVFKLTQIPGCGFSDHPSVLQAAMLAVLVGVFLCDRCDTGKKIFFKNNLLAGVGIALDAVNVVLNSIDLAEGSKSIEQDKILEVREKLIEEMATLEKVHRGLTVIFHGL